MKISETDSMSESNCFFYWILFVGWECCKYSAPTAYRISNALLSAFASSFCLSSSFCWFFFPVWGASEYFAFAYLASLCSCLIHFSWVRHPIQFVKSDCQIEKSTYVDFCCIALASSLSFNWFYWLTVFAYVFPCFGCLQGQGFGSWSLILEGIGLETQFDSLFSLWIVDVFTERMLWLDSVLS